MYAKGIQIYNYGPIDRLNLNFPFEEYKPKPVVFVGENGSGKSIVLSHIVNGLLLAQQVVYPSSPEAESGRVYKLRSNAYIKEKNDFSFARVDFEQGLHVAELQLSRKKKEYPKCPVEAENSECKTMWNNLNPELNSAFDSSIGANHKSSIEDLLSTSCLLYFPPNRFEDPAWLNEENLKYKASYMDLTHIEGYTSRKIVDYSPLRKNEEWLFDVVYDFSVFERQTHNINFPIEQPDKSKVAVPIPVFGGFSGPAKAIYDAVLEIVRTVLASDSSIRLGIGRRSERVISIMRNDDMIVRNIFQLSSGQVSLLNLFLSILRDYDLCNQPFNSTSDLRGIVVVDEIDLHLNAVHQYEILPKLVKMFPSIQFIVTTHSPLFVLGLSRIFEEEGAGIFHMPQGRRISAEEFNEFDRAYCAFSETQRHSEMISNELKNSRRPILFVDGSTDVSYLMKAAQMLGKKELLDEMDVRDGAGMLKNIWKGLTRDHVERQLVILLHDCDDKVPNGNRENVYRLTMPMIEENPIKRGIENLFFKKTLERAIKFKPAFIDIESKHQIVERGKTKEIPEEWSINKDEKANLCEWICDNATNDDFKYFESIIDDVIKICSSYV